MSSGSLDLGNLYGRLLIDYSGLSEAEQAAAAFSINTQKKLERVSKNLTKTGKVLSASVTAPIIGAGIASAKLANDFDKSVREVNSLLGDADKDFEGLKNQIRGVSLALGTDLTDSAKSAYQAISAGVSKDNLVDFLTVASKAAIAGVTQTEVAVDGLSTVMNAWKASAGSASDVADVMFTAVKNGKTTFEELSASIFHAAGIAPELGVSFKEIAAATAQMTAQGIPTSVALTQMRSSMVALSKPNEEMEKLLKAAGVTSVKTSIGTLGLVGTLDKLKKASEKSKLSLDKAMGGSEAMGLVYKATGENAASFAKNLNDMNSSLGMADGAFEELDKARAFEKLINTLKSLATLLGDQLLPIITPIVVSFTQWLSKANELDPGMVRLGMGIAAVAAAVGPLLLGAGSLLAVLTPIIASGGGLTAVLGSMAAAAGPVGIAIAAIVATAYLLYKNWDTVKVGISNIISSIVGYFKKWQIDNSGLIASISSNWNAFVESGKQLWTTLSTVIGEFVSKSITWLNKMLEPIGGLQGAWELFKVTVSSALTLIGEGLNAFLAGFKIVFDEINKALTSGDWSFFKELALTAIKLVSEGFTKYYLLVWDTLKKLPGIFREIFTEIVTYIKSIDFLQLGKDMMQGLVNGLTSMGQSVITTTKNVMGAVVEGAKKAVDSNSPSLVFMQIGKDIMLGLGLGIKANTNSVVYEMIKAAESLNDVAKEKLTQKTFSGFEANLMLNSNFGFDNNYELEIEKEKAYYANSMAMLEEAQSLKLTSISSYAAMREHIENKHANSIIEIQRSILSNTRSSLDQTLSSLESFGQKQSGIYKAIFAVSKAFAIAEAALAMGQNIANASKVGFPYNIPFIAGAIAQGAAIAANVSSVSGAFNNGGYIPTGQVGMVGEKGAEFVSGPANVFSTQNTKELLNGKGGGGSDLTVKIYNLPGQTATVSKDKDNATIIRIAVDTAKRELAHEARTGGGTTIPAILKAGGQKRRA